MQSIVVGKAWLSLTKHRKVLVHFGVTAFGFIVVHQIAFGIDIAVNLAFWTRVPVDVKRRQIGEEL